MTLLDDLVSVSSRSPGRVNVGYHLLTERQASLLSIVEPNVTLDPGGLSGSVELLPLPKLRDAVGNLRAVARLEVDDVPPLQGPGPGPPVDDETGELSLIGLGLLEVGVVPHDPAPPRPVPVERLDVEEREPRRHDRFGLGLR